MKDAIDSARLRQVALTAPEIKVLNVMMQTMGETAWYPERVKPLTNQVVDGMIAKDLVELVNPNGTIAPSSRGPRKIMRLTDNGRAVCAQIELMNISKKIEVVSG